VAVWEIVAQGQALRQARRPFALATVVRCERPASARPGDQALITEDGHVQGWIGGSCTEPVIVREALRALRTGHGCLVRLGPPHAQPGVTPEGVTVYPMTCHSGGTLEFFAVKSASLFSFCQSRVFAMSATWSVFGHRYM
jgi:xanthine dehydrogenase accessory factor